MLANELRLNNYISDGILTMQVNEISNVCRAYTDIASYTLNWENIEPIPLTEEWLRKFGFKKHREAGKYGYRYYIPVLDWGIVVERDFNKELSHFLKEEDYGSPDGKDDYKPYSIAFDYKWVHQLQNAYYALTGKELTIKTK